MLNLFYKMQSDPSPFQCLFFIFGKYYPNYSYKAHNFIEDLWTGRFFRYLYTKIPILSKTKNVFILFHFFTSKKKVSI